MHPHDADDADSRDSDDTSPARSEGRGNNKRTILLSGVGATVVVALIVVFVVTGGGGANDKKPVDVAAPSPATTTLDLSFGSTATTTAGDRGQPPGTVRLPGGSTAELVKKELTENGTLPIPKDLDKAAWWGAGLGESGAMLLSGHVNWNGERGPFHALLSIQPGQKVTVIDKSGGKWVYRVHDVRKISKEKLPAVASELFGQDGKHRLVLVTCGGEFVGGETGYASNIIAIANLVSSPQ